MIEHKNLTAPFPVNSLAVDIENVFLLERAVASILDLNSTVKDLKAVNFSEFRAILNQSEDAVVDLAEVVRVSINQLAGVEVTEETILVIESMGYFRDHSYITSALKGATQKQMTVRVKLSDCDSVTPQIESRVYQK